MCPRTIATHHVIAGVLPPLELELVILHNRQQLDRIHTQLYQIRHLRNEWTLETKRIGAVVAGAIASAKREGGIRPSQKARSYTLGRT